MKITSRLRRIRFVAAVGITVAGCFSAGAAEIDTLLPESFTFRFERTRLQTAGGVIAVYGDLQRSARRACNIHKGGSALWRARRNHLCVAGLVDKVVMASGAPELEVHHQGTSYYTLVHGAEGVLRLVVP